MAQQDVVDLLRKERKYLNARQISKKLKCTHSSLNRQLNQLVKYKKIQVKAKGIKIGNNYKRDVNHFKYKPVRRKK